MNPQYAGEAVSRRGLMPPISPPRQMNYSPDEFETELVSDFSGGLNITDPVVTLPKNQFETMLGCYFDRQRTVYSVPPYRPESFSTTIQSKPAEVWVSGVKYTITTLLDMQVFRETLSNGWSYNNAVYVVSGIFTGTDAAVKCIVAVYNTSNAAWVPIWNDATATDVSVTSYKINQAFDLIIFPNAVAASTNPERWTPDNTGGAGAYTGVLSDLGLPGPADVYFALDDVEIGVTPIDITTIANHGLSTGDYVYFEDIEGTVAPILNDSTYEVTVTSAKVFTINEATNGKNYTNDTGKIGTRAVPSINAAVTNGQGIQFNGEYFYKASAFYDDANVSTKYGESECSDETHHVNITTATDTDRVTVTIHNIKLPTGVTKTFIYRSPADTPAGPYKLIGEQVGDGDFIDAIPVGEEGVECIPLGSNPSASGSELSVLNARTVGAYIVGFDASMPYKLIWSTAGQPDVWNPLNFDYLDATGELAIEFNRKIYIFTKNSAYEKATMESAAAKISNIGCVDGKSVQEVGKGLIWADYDTIYFADFVQQYGSKGDFPQDIGHPISVSVLRQDTAKDMSSSFFERRYNITYTETEDSIKRTYVYDVDIGAWTQHAMNHHITDRGDNTLFSFGQDDDGRWFVYEHDYSATVAAKTWGSTYSGKDYHNYRSSMQPVGHWKMNDHLGTKNVIDASVTGNDGTAGANTDTLTATGLAANTDTSLSFDGATDVVTVTDNAAYDFTSQMSVFEWVKPGTLVNSDGLISKYTTAGNLREWSMLLTGVTVGTGKIVVYIGNLDGSAVTQETTDSVVLAVNTTAHVGFTFNAGVVSIYVNGVKVDSTKNGTHSTIINNKGVDITIGKHGTNYIDADIDDVRIYDKTLDSSEVSELYNESNGTETESFLSQIETIEASISRSNIRLGGDFRKIFVSSLSVESQGSVISILATIASIDNEFSTSKTFASGSESDSVTAFAAVYGTAVYADGTGDGSSYPADADEAGWVGFTSVAAGLHKKIKRVIKSNAIGVTLTSADSRNLKILYIVIYWKALPLLA